MQFLWIKLESFFKISQEASVTTVLIRNNYLLNR